MIITQHRLIVRFYHLGTEHIAVQIICGRSYSPWWLVVLARMICDRDPATTLDAQIIWTCARDGIEGCSWVVGKGYV